MDIPRAHSALCAAAESKMRNSIGSHSTHQSPLSYCYCKRGEGGCACSLLSHRGPWWKPPLWGVRPMSEWDHSPLSFPPLPRVPNLPGHDIIIVDSSNTNFYFVGKRRQALRMSEGNAAIQVTSKPKERHASITARLIRTCT